MLKDILFYIFIALMIWSYTYTIINERRKRKLDDQERRDRIDLEYWATCQISEFFRYDDHRSPESAQQWILSRTEDPKQHRAFLEKVLPMLNRCMYRDCK